MNFRALVSTILDVVFPAKRAKQRQWELMRPAQFEHAATKSAHDAVLASANALALFSYNDPLVREALHALKYSGEKSVAALFGALIADHLKEELSGHMLLSEKMPLLVPVPVTFGRHIERSYNQTELIAREVAARLPEHVEHAPGVLARTAFHGSQALAPTRRERSENVRGVFSVKDQNTVRGRDVILLDDIITTGATTNEAAATLLGCGARSVSCIAVAH